MKRYLGLLAVVALALSSMGFFGQPQSDVATTLTSATTAAVDCDSSTDAVRNATATPACTSTGSILTEGWSQLTVPVVITRASSTTINMQCDTSSDGTVWAVVPKVTPDGVSTPRTWTYAFTTSGNVAFTQNTQAKYMRCRFWFTDSSVANKITVATVRLASIVAR